MKVDLRLSKQKFVGQLDEVFTLHRCRNANNLGMVAVYYELHSSRKGLDSVFTIEDCQSPKELKQQIIKRLVLVTNQYFRP